MSRSVATNWTSVRVGSTLSPGLTDTCTTDASIGDETVIQFAPTGVTSAEATFREASFGEHDEATVVKFHHRANDRSGGSFERQMEKFALGIFINRDDESDKIHADVEQLERPLSYAVSDIFGGR